MNSIFELVIRGREARDQGQLKGEDGRSGDCMILMAGGGKRASSLKRIRALRSWSESMSFWAVLYSPLVRLLLFYLGTHCMS